MKSTRREKNRNTAMNLRRAITKLALCMRKCRKKDALSSNKVAVLGSLYREGPSSPSEIAGSENQQPQSFTRIFAELEKQEMIARSPHPKDRRQIVFSLTEHGKQTLKKDMQQRDQWLLEKLDEMNETEVEVLRLAARIMHCLVGEGRRDNDE
jgi:DNA-binding MarR family transcriptional regulator